MKSRLIGVFDSGIGGLSVAQAIERALPKHRVVFKNDAVHVPYGTRSVRQIHDFVRPILEDLAGQGCDVIVVACNTVTTNLIVRLREEINVPLIGMEPMVKPAAAASRSGVIAVCATPRTLQSRRYQWLKNTYGGNIRVLEPDCSDWSGMIESNQLDRRRISKIVETICRAGADQIVLGCTHYHWIEELIKELAKGRAAVLQPEEPVINQLKRVLQRLP